MGAKYIFNDLTCYSLLTFITLLIPLTSWTQGWEKHYPFEPVDTFFEYRSNLISPTDNGGALIITPGDIIHPLQSN